MHIGQHVHALNLESGKHYQRYGNNASDRRYFPFRLRFDLHRVVLEL